MSKPIDIDAAFAAAWEARGPGAEFKERAEHWFRLGVQAVPSRRVRVCKCPYCEKVTPVGRRWEGEDKTRFSICDHCYIAFESEHIETWLANYPLNT